MIVVNDGIDELRIDQKIADAGERLRVAEAVVCGLRGVGVGGHGRGDGLGKMVFVMAALPPPSPKFFS